MTAVNKSDKNVMSRLEPSFEAVNDEIASNLSTDIPYINQVCEYTLLGGGKRIRPVLFILSARLCGYDKENVFRLSTMLEFLHAATLLHDDVIDEADTRRGRPAAHKVYGNQGVILVGDYLVSKTLSLAVETGLIKFLEVISETSRLMAEGEVLQLLHAQDAEITEAEYERVIHRKTGALIQSACRLGAILSEASEEKENSLLLYGEKVGQAFQIIDDTLDYTATASEFGKPVGHDLDEGKITLPVIIALKKASPDDHVEMRNLIIQDSRTPEEFARVKELIIKYDGINQSISKAAELIAQAKASLADFPDIQEKKDMIDLADFIVYRKK